MKIGFDGKRAANNLTGLGNYSRSLITQLALSFPQNQYFVYTPKIKRHPQISRFLDAEHITTVLPRGSKFLWRSIGIKKQLTKDKIDLFHGLSHEIPIGMHKSGIPSVVTIHDLIFIRFPLYFNAIDRFIYNVKFRYACEYADRIVAISELTKKDVVKYFNVNPDKIDVVYQSCDDSFKAEAEQSLKDKVKAKYELPSKYILNVGTIETRKNLLTLVRALKNIREDYKLVVVGKKTVYFDRVIKEAERLNLTSRIIFLENVLFNELPAIYQMATLFAYPSRYEGFGIPIIEALYSGVPVVAAAGSCLEEAGGKDSVYVPSLKYNIMAEAINNILDSPELQQQMKLKGLEFVQRFNNENISQEMMKVYTNVLSNYQK